MSSDITKAPIGIFDSGIGGLTVVKHLMELLPYENIVYFGDTARVPYGTKSEDSVKRFAFEDSHFLLEHNVKIIVVACNTVSATAIHLLKKYLPVPVIGVMMPGAKAAVEKTKNGKIGVIGTSTTIRSEAYKKKIKSLEAQRIVYGQACPLFVPLVEEGLIEDEATRLIAGRYLKPLMENGVDTLILGCTHYPVLKDIINDVTGNKVALVDSGEETAKEVKKFIELHNLDNKQKIKPKIKFYVSDLPHKFQETAERFLHKTIPHIETVDFDQFLVKKGRKFQKEIDNILLER